MTITDIVGSIIDFGDNAFEKDWVLYALVFCAVLFVFIIVFWVF